MPWFCYILECERDTLYTGVTKRPKERFKKHKEGEAAKYTRANEPKKVVWLKEFEDKKTAMKKEAEIKSWERSKKRELINSFEAVPIKEFVKDD